MDPKQKAQLRQFNWFSSYLRKKRKKDALIERFFMPLTKYNTQSHLHSGDKQWIIKNLKRLLI